MVFETLRSSGNWCSMYAKSFRMHEPMLDGYVEQCPGSKIRPDGIGMPIGGFQHRQTLINALPNSLDVLPSIRDGRPIARLVGRKRAIYGIDSEGE